MGKAYGKADADTLKEGKLVNVQCFPFYSVLLALGRTSIDYFSLDVEGQEFNILKTVPWHKIDIKVVCCMIIISTYFHHQLKIGPNC